MNSFDALRDWIIGQGKVFYYKTINDPETLAELETEFLEESSEFEGLSQVPLQIFKELTEQELPLLLYESKDMSGNWDEQGDSLKCKFPKIYAKYPNNI